MYPELLHPYSKFELKCSPEALIRESLDDKDKFEKTMKMFCDPVTWTEFWSKNQEILYTLYSDSNVVIFTESMPKISQFIKDLYHRESQEGLRLV